MQPALVAVTIFVYDLHPLLQHHILKWYWLTLACQIHTNTALYANFSNFLVVFHKERKAKRTVFWTRHVIRSEIMEYRLLFSLFFFCPCAAVIIYTSITPKIANFSRTKCSAPTQTQNSVAYNSAAAALTTDPLLFKQNSTFISAPKMTKHDVE